MTKCPICEGNFKLIFDVNYDEPPERLTECQDCGFSEYYFYYEGYTTSIRSFKFDEKSQYYERVEFCVVNKSEEFVNLEEYKLALNEELKKLGFTLAHLISIRKERDKFLKEKEIEKKEKEMNDKIRWENEDYTQEELLKIDKFLSQEVMKVKDLEKIGVTINLKEKDGLLTNISFEIDDKKAAEYEMKKIKAQKEYAVSTSAPMFAPNSCFNCYTRIFGVEKENKVLFGKSYEFIKEHLSIEKCSTTLITGCPRCSRSYVD